MRAETETVWEQAFRVSSKRPPVDEHIGSRLLNFTPRFPPRLHRRSRKSKVQRPFENAPAWTYRPHWNYSAQTREIVPSELLISHGLF